MGISRGEKPHDNPALPKTAQPMTRSYLAGRTQSGFTDDEMQRVRLQYEARAWHCDGLVLIRLDDASVPQGVRDMAEAIGITRFGPRKAGNGASPDDGNGGSG